MRYIILYSFALIGIAFIWMGIQALIKKERMRKNNVDPNDFWRILNIEYYERFPELAEEHGWDRKRMRYKETDAKSIE